MVELAEDDRAVILGLLVEAAAPLRGDDGAQQLLLWHLWHRRGQRMFDADPPPIHCRISIEPS